MATLKALLSIILILQIVLAAPSRQKRCIVIQRQSGALSESSEEDEGWRAARQPNMNKNHVRDVEVITPEFLKQLAPAMRSEFIRLRNKFNSFKNNVI